VSQFAGTHLRLDDRDCGIVFVENSLQSRKYFRLAKKYYNSRNKSSLRIKDIDSTNSDGVYVVGPEVVLKKFAMSRQTIENSSVPLSSIISWFMMSGYWRPLAERS
jgi:hypothetical protein